MWRARYVVKAVVARVLYSLGVLNLWQSRALRGKAVVLMYHRVLSAEARAQTASHPGYVVSASTFARQMACLKGRFTVLSEREFVGHLDEGRPFADSSCLITFDDGWHDNLTHALPVLRHHRLPAVVYLPVHFIGTRRLFWREALTHLVLRALHGLREGRDSDGRTQGALEALGLGQVLAIADPDPRAAVVEAVAQQAHRRMDGDDAVLRPLEQALDVRCADLPTPDTFLSWDDVRHMSREGIAFGGHGVEHRLLGELPAVEAEHEVRESMTLIAARTGSPPLGFSYPNGSHTSEVVEMVKAAGYRVAFTTEPGAVDARDDRFRIRRVNIHEDMTDTTPLFLARVLGLF